MTALERVATTYQVPPEYLVAILGVETRYGRVTGHYRVLQVRKGHPKRVAIRSLALDPSRDKVTLTLGAFNQHEPLLLRASGLLDANGMELSLVSAAL